MRRTKASTNGRPRQAADESIDLAPPATTAGLAASPRTRTGPATSTPPTPLDVVLRNAADRATDPAVRTWLRALQQHGEAACGGGVGLLRPLDSGRSRP